MEKSPAILDVLSSVRWQLFVSLTFYDPKRPHFVPNEGVQKCAFFAWARQFCRWHRIHFKHSLLWVMRFERGEITGRQHLHGLLGGLPESALGMRSRFAIKNSWQQFSGGSSRVRLFGASETGDYLLKPDQWTGEDAYESAKFGSQDCKVILSHTTWEYVARSRSLSMEVQGKIERVKRMKNYSVMPNAYANPLAHPYDTTPFTLRRR